MGAKNSKLPSPVGPGAEGQPSDSSSSPRPTPLIEAPYAGPWAEYQFVDVTVPVESDVTFSSSDVTLASTNCSSVLPMLASVYSQGYSLVTFCRVPAGASSSNQKRMFSPGREMHYQAIFCRYEGDPDNEGWSLRVEKSLLQTQHVTPGVVSTETGPGAQHIQQLISNTVQTGGRLLTVQWSGQPQQSSSEAALGVDVFFEVPNQALPERSVYQLVTAPATISRRSLFASRGHVTCDWAGILTRHLAHGWRLVDIFCEVPATGLTTALSSANVKIQTVWFFEKPESRARNDSAVYEGTIVEQWIDVPSSSSSSCSSSSIMSGSAAGCLGGGRGAVKKAGGTAGKRSAARRMVSVRKKTDEAATHGEGEPKRNDDAKQGSCKQKDGGCTQTENSHAANEADAQRTEEKDQNRLGGEAHQTVPQHTGSQGTCNTAGWEGMVRSMGEKGWELASVVNTMDSQVVSGKPRAKVLLVFQRRISLVMSVKGRRTSDGLALRADTGASTSVMCDIPMMTGETASHLNPSLAVRLPLSRSGSREHDDFNASCDDIPSTIGGSCSRTHSATELSVTGRVIESGFLEPGRGSRRGREEGFLRPKPSAGDDASIGTEERSSPGSQRSKVTAAEVHIPRGEGEEASPEKWRQPRNDSSVDEKPSDPPASSSSESAKGQEANSVQTVDNLPQSETTDDSSSAKVAIVKKQDSGGGHNSVVPPPDSTHPAAHDDNAAAASSPGTQGQTQQPFHKPEAAVRGEEATACSGENGMSHGSRTNQINTPGCTAQTDPGAPETPDIGDQNEAATVSLE